MPDQPPGDSRDDAFADLFGKLPDPRERESGAAGAPGGGASSGATPPLSRRAAREAAARAGDPGEPTDAGASTPPVTPPPIPSAPGSAAPPQPVTPSAPVAAPVSVGSSYPGPRRSGGTDAAPAAPRASATRTATATAPSASLEDLFSGEVTTDAVVSGAPVSSKRKRRLGGWIVLALVLVLLGGVAAGGLWVWNTYEDRIRSFMGWEEPRDYEEGIAEGEVDVTIVSGDNGSTISQTLFDAGVTKTAGVFYDYLISTGQNPNFQPGVFKLSQKMTAAAALTALEEPANKIDNAVQLREGLTVAQSVPIIAEQLGLPQDQVQAAVDDPSQYGIAAESLEGWLFPATYRFDPGVTAVDVVRTMVERAVQSLDAAAVPEADRQRILNIASIIQREARSSDDFYKVSRVIQNRLALPMRLEMDSTAQYGYGELHDGTVSSSQAALDDVNAWNTYEIDGLPATPIANPGDDAIDAAMHPADGNWLFFVTVNLATGETVFSDDFAAHEQAILQWQQWCRDNPDGGC